MKVQRGRQGDDAVAPDEEVGKGLLDPAFGFGGLGFEFRDGFDWIACGQVSVSSAWNSSVASTALANVRLHWRSKRSETALMALVRRSSYEASAMAKRDLTVLNRVSMGSPHWLLGWRAESACGSSLRPATDLWCRMIARSWSIERGLSRLWCSIAWQSGHTGVRSVMGLT